jgi:tRNA(fMet)-specific endonuclease VapC
MANQIILVDTSVLIDFLRKEHKDRSILWMLRGVYSCAISSVTLFELLAGAKIEKQRQDVAKLCKWIEVLPFDSACAEMAGEIFLELKKQNSLIEFRDIFIGSTARYHQLHLATLNTAHFARMRGVHLIDLAKI